MQPLFDTEIDRTQHCSFKWEKYKGQDVLPMWVADTEFRCAEPILEALRERVDHGPLGYTLPNQYEPGKAAVIRWLEKQHGWTVHPEWIVWNPGVCPAFNVACKAYCEPGDQVLVQTPNYPPLMAAPSFNELERVDVPTIEDNERWMIDLEALERAAANPKAKLLILCNPMNPVGTVLTADELAQVADICERHNIVLCSDEVHCDLILDEQATHIPAGKLASLAERSVTLMAASKTFNIAGLGTSFAIIPDGKLRAAFNRGAQGIVPWANVMGLIATEAAFTRCDHWYDDQIRYLRRNRDYLVEQINQIDGLRMLTPQATFLAWIDGSGLPTDNPQQWFEERGVGPSPGADFADKRFVRINFGCPLSQLEEAVRRIRR